MPNRFRCTQAAPRSGSGRVGSGSGFNGPRPYSTGTYYIIIYIILETRCSGCAADSGRKKTEPIGSAVSPFIV